MDLSALSAQTPQALSALISQLKAEQAKASGQAQTPQSLGAQIVQALEASNSNPLTGATSTASSDPLGQLFDTTSASEDSSSPSVSDLAALLVKTKPGKAGDSDRAAILATLSSGQSASNASASGSSLFDFLG